MSELRSLVLDAIGREATALRRRFKTQPGDPVDLTINSIVRTVRPLLPAATPHATIDQGAIAGALYHIYESRDIFRGLRPEFAAEMAVEDSEDFLDLLGIDALFESEREHAYRTQATLDEIEMADGDAPTHPDYERDAPRRRTKVMFKRIVWFIESWIKRHDGSSPSRPRRDGSYGWPKG